jgi:hypothetical protein
LWLGSFAVRDRRSDGSRATVTKELAPAIRQSGAILVDNSSALRAK